MNNRILIVDDTKSWQVFHKDLIRNLYGDRFGITTASSAGEAYELICKNSDNPFLLVMTDLQMEADYEPELAGEWLIENIQKLPEYSLCRYLIVSGYIGVERISKRLNAECISKSILVRNHNFLKFAFEKMMPYLGKIDKYNF